MTLAKNVFLLLSSAAMIENLPEPEFHPPIKGILE